MIDFSLSCQQKQTKKNTNNRDHDNKTDALFLPVIYL